MLEKDLSLGQQLRKATSSTEPNASQHPHLTLAYDCVADGQAHPSTWVLSRPKRINLPMGRESCQMKTASSYRKAMNVALRKRSEVSRRNAIMTTNTEVTEDHLHQAILFRHKL